MLMRLRERLLLLAARFLLVLRLPLLVRHAIDDLARLRVGERHALLLGGGAVPFRQAVAAEAGEIHQVDVLHVGAFAQVLDQAPERGGLQLGAGLVVHCLPHSKVWVSAISWSTTMHSAGSRSIPSSIARR